jgi:hypothetical protein
VLERLTGELVQVVAGVDHPLDAGEHVGHAVGGQRLRQVEAELDRQRPEHPGHVGQGDLLAGVGEHLVEPGQAVAVGAVGGPGDQLQRGGLDVDLLGRADPGEVVDQQRRADATEVVPLAAGADRLDDLVRLGGAEHEADVLRRLLEHLEHRVEALGGDHVGLVDDVDLVAGRRRGVAGPLAQVAGVVDRPVAGGVDLDHVEVGAVGDGAALLADVVGLRGGSLLAVEGLGQHPGGGGLARPPGAAEQHGVVHLAGLDGVDQRSGHVVLAHDVREGLWAPFAVERDVGHGRPRLPQP